MDKSIMQLKTLLEAADETKVITTGNTVFQHKPAVAESTVIILGGYGGRFDQEIACISSLYRWQGVFGRMVLLCKANCSFLLEPGYRHRICCSCVQSHKSDLDSAHTAVGAAVVDSTSASTSASERSSSWILGPTCGLLPLGGPVRSITTSGLQWNLQGENLQLGVRISSSNAVLPCSAEVVVETSDSVLWTIQMHSA